MFTFVLMFIEDNLSEFYWFSINIAGSVYAHAICYYLLKSNLNYVVKVLVKPQHKHKDKLLQRLIDLCFDLLN